MFIFLGEDSKDLSLFYFIFLLQLFLVNYVARINYHVTYPSDSNS